MPTSQSTPDRAAEPGEPTVGVDGAAEPVAREIITEEEGLLAVTVARLSGAAPDAGADAPAHDYDSELIELRDAIGEAKPEDLAPLVEQMARLQAIAARRGRSRTLPVDPLSPYFAHLRLREDGKERDILIGKRGFVERGGVPIVDWRNAPVSKIYYRYEEGDDYDETEGASRLEGVVTARRNLSIVMGRLRRIGCPAGTFVRDARGEWRRAHGQIRPTLQGGQGIASRPPRPAPAPPRGGPGRGQGQVKKLGIHGGAIPRADKHLPEIAALIDREQFDLITAPTSGLVLIQGGAGSGKTTVALHRVAFLNFADPHRFSTKKLLVVVPSVALASYVAGVLPSLGVKGVAVHTYRHWARMMRKRVVPRAGDRYSEDTPDAIARVKKHPALLVLLEELVATEARTAAAELARELQGVPGGAAIVHRFRELERRPLVSRCRRLLSWMEKQGEALPAAVRHQADTVLRRIRRHAGDVARLLFETLTDLELLRRGFAGRLHDRDLLATVSWATRQRDEAPDEEYEGIDRERLTMADGQALDEEDTAAGRLDPEDDALLLRLVQLQYGVLADKKTGDEIGYEHVAIDEAQDLAAVDIKVLLEATHAVGGQRCVTIAGDSAQRLVFDNDFHDWKSHLRAAGHDAVEVRPLRLSYRSTAEVMRFARAILGPLADPDEPLVARNGAPVEAFRFAELGEAAAFLGDALRSLAGREPTASIAVITRFPEQADLIHGALVRAEVPALRRVRREDFAFVPGIDVTDVAQVKGLEFDYVILMDATVSSYPDAIEARHLLHIAATRAAHQLWVIVTAEPSPLLPEGMVQDQ